MVYRPDGTFTANTRNTGHVHVSFGKSTKPARDEDRVFHIFMKLPPELRLKIWKENFPEPRVVKLSWGNVGDFVKVTSSAPCNARTFLSVCSELRVLYLKHYQPVVTHGLTMRALSTLWRKGVVGPPYTLGPTQVKGFAPYSFPSSPYDLIDFRRDTVYIDRSTIDALGRNARWLDLSRAESLMLDKWDDPRLLWTYARSCEKLKRLRIGNEFAPEWSADQVVVEVDENFLHIDVQPARFASPSATDDEGYFYNVFEKDSLEHWLEIRYWDAMDAKDNFELLALRDRGDVAISVVKFFPRVPRECQERVFLVPTDPKYHGVSYSTTEWLDGKREGPAWAEIEAVGAQVPLGGGDKSGGAFATLGGLYDGVAELFEEE